MTNLMDLLNKILEAANEVVTWAKNVSSHTHHHEIRSMGARPLPHEVIRQISKLIEELRPHDDQISALMGDPGLGLEVCQGDDGPAGARR